MSLFAKIMVIVNFVLAVAFLAAAGTLLGAAEDYKKRYETETAKLQSEIKLREDNLNARDDKIKQLDAQKAELDKAATAATTAQKTLADSNDAMNRANAEMRASLEKLSTAQQDLQAKISEANSMLDRIRAELGTSETGRREALDKIKALTDDNARLAQDKDNAEKNQAAAEAAANAAKEKLDEVATTLERYKKEFGAISGGIAMKPVKGVIQAANPQVDVYVVSVGSKDEVKVGYEFTVYRGSEYVATIVIDKVWKDYCSGRTKPGTKRKDIQAGDECATQL